MIIVWYLCLAIRFVEKCIVLALDILVMPKSLIHRVGCRLSASVADFAANPLAQLGLLVICIGWFAAKLPVEVLTAALSILAITLTQMVLNKQNEREADAHRRDVALHAKLDELVIATFHARDVIAGIEDLDEEEIERLRCRQTTSRVNQKITAANHAKGV